MHPEELKYTKSHEWVRVEDGEAVVGITYHAQEQLGDITYIELPEVGRTVAAGETLGTVESVKAVADLFAPVSGEVVAVNEEAAAAPEIVNQDPYGRGWLVRLKLSKPEELETLLSAQEYEQTIKEE